jgi:FkbM family methyltransferase
MARVNLPWGAAIDVRPGENVGSDIFYFGIFDRIVPEAIYRLADAGELLVEAGANIGQNCSLMVYKTGASGKVIAFEPHPEIFAELKSNASLWPEKIRGNVRLENIALGDTVGEAWLTEGSYFDRNRGTASLLDRDIGPVPSRRHKVSVRRLDEYLPDPMKVGVFKIDVEGHELAVLRGAEQTFSRRAIRDIVFEDFCPMPSPVVAFLQKHGFTVFQLTANWWKPLLTELLPGVTPPAGFSYNYLATNDSQRARNRFRSVGWHCLMFRPDSA